MAPSFFSMIVRYRYLIQDGGNVVIQEIDGPVVKLQLQVLICADVILVVLTMDTHHI